MSDLASLFDAAEQAAVGGDFAAAGRLLADAARIQEATLGPDHLDLANTLNNLAVAHERSGQLDDAEREYRRAHSIAARTLPADDPLVTTSAQNLREFCEANGRPVERPALRLAAAEDPGAAATVVLARPPQADVPTAPIEPLAMTFATEPAASVAKAAPKPAPASPPVSTPSPAPVPRPAPAPRAASTPPPAPPPKPVPAPRSRVSIPVLVGLGAAAAFVIWLLAGRGPAAPPVRPEAAAPEASAAPATATPAPDVPASAPSAAPPAATAPAPAARPSPAASASTPVPSSGADGLTVAEARLCTTLSSGYRCEAAGATVPAGRLTFYTRLVARANTGVVHRWYRGSELRQAVRLDVPARRQGFRTFSRATVSPGEGEWRVELRSRDGQLLHVERFTVR
jgi:hypothetical protein